MDSISHVRLEERDRAFLAGDSGEAGRLAMRIVARTAEVMGADHLLDITNAHIDSCLYHGQAGLDFAQRLADGGAAVSVPTTLNVSSLDLLHPDLYRGDPETARQARKQMAIYEAMGAAPTWTCAPYQLPERPEFGDQIAWGESNAIVFANSVIGARTHRYGDFLDICAAVTGRAPAAGLHLTSNRRGQIVFRIVEIPDQLLQADVLFPVLGHIVGHLAERLVPVVDGLPATASEDQLKALGAASAASGSVGLFHAVGVTPEAPTLAAALQDGEPERIVDVTLEMVREARDSLTTSRGGRLGAVSIGTPHFSLDQFRVLTELIRGETVAVECYVSTGRDTLARVDEQGWGEILRAAGVQVVVDTCTYITPIINRIDGLVMTDSAKWAFYAPNNLGVAVAFGSLEECVRSAVTGEVQRDSTLWSDL